SFSRPTTSREPWGRMRIILSSATAGPGRRYDAMGAARAAPGAMARAHAVAVLYGQLRCRQSGQTSMSPAAMIEALPPVLRKACWTAYTAYHVRSEARLPFRPLDELRALQNRRVRAIVAYAYDTVPHYRDVISAARLQPRDFRTAEDLAQLPV